jgi:hypothetical protein
MQFGEGSYSLLQMQIYCAGFNLKNEGQLYLYRPEKKEEEGETRLCSDCVRLHDYVLRVSSGEGRATKEKDWRKRYEVRLGAVCIHIHG